MEEAYSQCLLLENSCCEKFMCLSKVQIYVITKLDQPTHDRDKCECLEELRWQGQYI